MTLMTLLEQYHIETTLRAVVLIALGFFVARLVSHNLGKVFVRKLTRQQSMLLGRFTFYLILLIFVATAIQQLGFKIGALLGATGILTVAIGIASQTSISNVISGFFIIAEKPFEIGNTIKVGDIEGEVMSIDLLSVKIRTADNMMIRIPNETLIKSAIVNISYFPKRRIDLLIHVAYKEPLEPIKKILFDTAEKNTFCLKTPKPTLLITGFYEAETRLKFSVWAENEDFNMVKNSIQEDIKNAFHQAEIELFPSRSFYTTPSDPLPVKIVT